MPDFYLICVSVAFVLSEFLPFVRDTQANGLLHAIQLLASRAAGVLTVPAPVAPNPVAPNPVAPNPVAPVDRSYRKKKRRSRSRSVDTPRIETTPMTHSVKI
jgi:hypothetical protein